VDDCAERDVQVPLPIVSSRYRELTAPVLDFLDGLRVGPRDVVQVFVPEYVVGHWWVGVYFAQLRRKLEDVPGAPRHFITEPGLGYRFEPSPGSPGCSQVT
jgi:hypothetical protein